MRIRAVDIHNHLLPGVDDGFKTAEESLEAIRGLSAAGVRELVFTPHINPDVYPQNDEARMRRGYCDFVATDLHSLHQLERILSSNPPLLLRRPLGNLFRG